jgi:phosphoglycerol transferase MdoB-like AlkP superfamily enzyme
MTQKSNSSNPGISALSILGIAFVVLKLCKVIDWSWWWVTLPFWGGLALVLIILLIILIYKYFKS